MKILFDTNVVLDVLLDRKPYSEAASLLFSKVERKEISGYLCATTVTTLYYLSAKTAGKLKATKEIRQLMQIFEVAPVHRGVLESALYKEFRDFEDAVLAESAAIAEVHAIVTRNPKDFRNLSITFYSPEQLLKVLASQG